MVAGVAAGISAVFRTPLGAALLAIEVLYRDDFESEALIPARARAVIAYSVVISIFGEATLFGHLGPFPFRPEHLPLYVALAIVVSRPASLFVGDAARVAADRRAAARSPSGRARRSAASRSACSSSPLIQLVGSAHRRAGPGSRHPRRRLRRRAGRDHRRRLAAGRLGGVEILLLLACAKILASSFTIGTGGSAGDFAPALVIGGLFGGAFGLRRAAAARRSDASIRARSRWSAMGTFYGGIAHTPLAALVLVCELAGSYDLLVPLMLAEGVAFVALRRVSLYPAQVPTLHDSPVHPASRSADRALTLWRHRARRGVRSLRRARTRRSRVLTALDRRAAPIRTCSRSSTRPACCAGSSRPRRCASSRRTRSFATSRSPPTS